MEKIQVSEGILRDLRARSGYSVGEVASKIDATPEKLQQIESGSSSTTISLIEKLADIYHRPLAAFFVRNNYRDIPCEFVRRSLTNPSSRPGVWHDPMMD